MAQDGSKQPWSITELSQHHATLYNAEVKHRSQLYYKRIEELNMLNAVQNGWHHPKDDEIEFRGEIYELDDAKRLLKKVDKELEKDNNGSSEQDRRVFMTYFQMALHINQEVAEELYRAIRLPPGVAEHLVRTAKAKRPGAGGRSISCNSQASGQLQSHHFQELLTDLPRHAQDDEAACCKHRGGHDAACPQEPARRPAVRPFLLEKNLVEGLSKYEQSHQHRNGSIACSISSTR